MLDQGAGDLFNERRIHIGPLAQGWQSGPEIARSGLVRRGVAWPRSPETAGRCGSYFCARGGLSTTTNTSRFTPDRQTLWQTCLGSAMEFSDVYRTGQGTVPLPLTAVVTSGRATGVRNGSAERVDPLVGMARQALARGGSPNGSVSLQSRLSSCSGRNSSRLGPPRSRCAAVCDDATRGPRFVGLGCTLR